MYRIDLSMLYLLAMDKFSASVLKSIFHLKFARESTCASVVIHTWVQAPIYHQGCMFQCKLSFFSFLYSAKCFVD